MKIFFDTSARFMTRGGTTRYIEQLMEPLQRKAMASRATFKEVAWPFQGHNLSRLRWMLNTFGRDLIWPWLRGACFWGQHTIVHCTGSVAYRTWGRAKRVVTVLDLAPLDCPGRYSSTHVYFFRKFYLPYVLSADGILCISEFTAQRLKFHLPGLSGKIKVTHLASFLGDRIVKKPSEYLPMIPSDYLLFVGSVDSGKNLDLMGEVYDLALQKGYPLPPLVVVGAKWFGDAARHNRKGWIQPGFVEDEVLLSLYQNAKVLVFPSKYEGFGLPVLEAMNSGCPVICSRVASLPEVAGDAAVYAEPNPESYLSGIQSLLSNSGFREKKIQAGRKRAKFFSWEKCAEETWRFYEEMVET